MFFCSFQGTNILHFWAFSTTLPSILADQGSVNWRSQSLKILEGECLSLHGNIGGWRMLLVLVHSQVDPLTSILAVLARSYQVLTTSLQPWIPCQDFYKDLTKTIPRSYLIPMDKIQNYKKTLYLRYKQPRLNLKAHFNQQRLFLLVFIIKMLQPAETNLHAKLRENLRYPFLASEIQTKS